MTDHLQDYVDNYNKLSIQAHDERAKRLMQDIVEFDEVADTNMTQALTLHILTNALTPELLGLNYTVRLRNRA